MPQHSPPCCTTPGWCGRPPRPCARSRRCRESQTAQRGKHASRRQTCSTARSCAPARRRRPARWPQWRSPAASSRGHGRWPTCDAGKLQARPPMHHFHYEQRQEPLLAKDKLPPSSALSTALHPKQRIAHMSTEKTWDSCVRSRICCEYPPLATPSSAAQPVKPCCRSASSSA